MSQNHEWVNDPFKVQDRPTGFNVTEYKGFTSKVSDSTLRLTGFLN